MMNFQENNRGNYGRSDYGNGPNLVKEIPIQNIIGKIISNWYWFALCSIIFLGGAWLYLKKQSNIYEVSASLFVSSEQKRGGREPDFMKEIEYFRSTSGLEDEVGVLSSYSLIAATIDSLEYGISYYVKEGMKKTELDKPDFPLLIRIDSSHIQLVKVLFRLEINEEGEIYISLDEDEAPLYDPKAQMDLGMKENIVFNQKVRPNTTIESPHFRITLDENPQFQTLPVGTYFFRISTMYDMVQSYKSNLSVDLSSDESNIVSLVLQGPVVRKDIAFLRQLIDNYLYQELVQKQENGLKTLDFIRAEIDSISDSLRNVENKLATFRSGSEIMDPASGAKKLQNQLEEIESKQLDVKLKLGYYRYISENLAKENPTSIPAPSMDDGSDPLLRALLEELSRLIKEKANMGFKTTKANPQYKLLEDQIAENKAAIVTNVSNHIRSLEISERELRSNAYKIRSKLSQLPNYEKGLNKIEREYSSINEMYKYLQEKRAEADIALANQSIQHKVIDPPHLASRDPIKPKKGFIMGLALLMGLGFPFLMITVSELLKTKINTRKDIQANTSIPILGYIAKNNSDEKIIHSDMMQTYLAESFRTLRVKLQYSNKDLPQKIIGVTSSWSGEGKSFCSANLSCVTAMVGSKTLLIDLDFRKPSQQYYFDNLGERGLVDYLTGDIDYEDVIYPTHIPGLEIIPVGQSNYNPLDLLDQQKFHDLISTLKTKYDKIIIDTPPIGRTSDYLMFIKWIDLTVYVVRHKYTKAHAFQEINELYESGRITNIGIVVNAVSNLNFFQYGEAGLYGQQKDHYDNYYTKV